MSHWDEADGIGLWERPSPWKSNNDCSVRPGTIASERQGSGWNVTHVVRKSAPFEKRRRDGGLPRVSRRAGEAATIIPTE